MKKIVTLLLCISIFFNMNVIVNASGNTDLDVFIHSDSNGYSMPDPSSMPSGYYYYYKYDEGKAWYTSFGNTLPLILNKGLGITVSDTLLIPFTAAFNIGIEAYCTAVDFAGKSMNVYNMGTFCGRALNDITGCKLVNPSTTASNPQYSIPSTEVNIVYELYEEYLEDNNLDLPDYINLECRTVDWFKSNLNKTSSYYQSWSSYLNNYSNIKLRLFNYDPGSLKYGCSNMCYEDEYGDFILVANSNYDNYCESLNLTQSKNSVPFTSQLLRSSGISINRYDLTNYQTVGRRTIVTYLSNSTNVAFAQQSGQVTIGNSGYLGSGNDGYITIYKNANITSQIVNETYAPSSFYSQQYYNYSQDNDNSVVTNQEEVDNSTTTNETIYNNSSESFTEYYSENNYNIDNSVVINNNTEIVNNYYGSDNGGDDNGGGSGGGSDDSDGSLLDRLLNAILDFFKGIAKIITAILTGIFELFNSILEAIANITTSFEGITNLFSAIFGWLPDPIINLMVLGLGLALLAAFITWFR